MDETARAWGLTPDAFRALAIAAQEELIAHWRIAQHIAGVEQDLARQKANRGA